MSTEDIFKSAGVRPIGMLCVLAVNTGLWLYGDVSNSISQVCYWSADIDWQSCALSFSVAQKKCWCLKAGCSRAGLAVMLYTVGLLRDTTQGSERPCLLYFPLYNVGRLRLQYAVGLVSLQICLIFSNTITFIQVYVRHISQYLSNLKKTLHTDLLTSFHFGTTVHFTFKILKNHKNTS